MFTGLIEATAKVISFEGGRLTLGRPKIFDDINIGSSICVSGVCLSVIDLQRDKMSFDVVETTRTKSKLGSLKKNDLVNLERAMKADGRFEGHMVLGHVEGVATVVSLAKNMLTIELPKDLTKFVVRHGCITVDGVSLTIAASPPAPLPGPPSAEGRGEITVALIPHTLEHTTLGSLTKGDKVNLETDILGKYVHGR